MWAYQCFPSYYWFSPSPLSVLKCVFVWIRPNCFVLYIDKMWGNNPIQSLGFYWIFSGVIPIKIWFLADIVLGGALNPEGKIDSHTTLTLLAFFSQMAVDCFSGKKWQFYLCHKLLCKIFFYMVHLSFYTCKRNAFKVCTRNVKEEETD